MGLELGLVTADRVWRSGMREGALGRQNGVGLEDFIWGVLNGGLDYNPIACGLSWTGWELGGFCTLIAISWSP